MASLAGGKELVETGGGKAISCGSCHGENLKRLGAEATLMKPVANTLDGADIVAISAYLASLAP